MIHFPCVHLEQFAPSPESRYTLLYNVVYSRGIEDGSGGHGSEQSQVFQSHLAGSIFTDGDSTVGTDQVYVGLTDGSHADLKLISTLKNMMVDRSQRRTMIMLVDITIPYDWKPREGREGLNILFFYTQTTLSMQHVVLNHIYTTFYHYLISCPLHSFTSGN